MDHPEKKALQIRQVSFRNRKGHTLRGVITLPEGEEKVPCLLLLHGFTGNVCGYKGFGTRVARNLARQGIGCARFDFYGNGESDGEFQDMTFTGLYEDAEDMFTWLRRQEFADPDRLYLGGQSMGGYVAASCAPKLKPRGLLLLCPGASMWFGAKKNADAITAQGKEFVDLEGLQYQIAFNYDMASHPNPFEEARGYEGPVFLARAADDKLVDSRTLETYAAGYQETETLTTEGGGHNFASMDARQVLTEKMAAFILSHR